MTDTDEIYDEKILQARDICANCHQRVRVERVDPILGDGEQDVDAEYARHRRRTTVEYGPSETVSESKGTFCTCGVEDHAVKDRVWSDPIPREKFEDLLKATLRSLGEKGVTLDRHRAAAVALGEYKDGADADAALSRGVEIGLAVSTARGDNTAEGLDV